MGLSSELKRINPEEMGLHTITKEELARLKQVLLEMTSYIKTVCDENRIEWGLCGGSALGAIRHKGFIPWDDDIDICMTRENFNKFKGVFNNSQDNQYELLIPGDEEYYYHFPRVINKHTVLTNIQSCGRGTGVFIDIFIVEDMYDSGVMKKLHGLECNWYLFVISCLATHLRKAKYYLYGTPEVIKKVRIRDFFSIFFRFRSIENWIKKADTVFSRAENPDSEYVCVPSGVKHYFGEIYKREDMCRFQVMPFEDREFPVYSGVHNIMRQRYGEDYMELPPEEKREVHTCIEIKL